MGVALGWMALALAAVAGAPDAGRGGVPIKYTVQFMEADGVAWREAVFARLTPVTRQGSATVWTAPHDVANRLVEQAKKSPTARILQAPKVIAWSGATAHIIARTNQELVTQAAWNVRRELGPDEAGDGPHRLDHDAHGPQARPGRPGSDGAPGHAGPRRAPHHGRWVEGSSIGRGGDEGGLSR